MQALLIYPILILIIYSLISIFIAIFAKVRALKNNLIDIEDFALMDFHAKASTWVTKTNNNASNLFQIPILFYVCVLLILIFNMHTVFYVLLAWLYVGFRILNSIIHLSYNNVIHRLVSSMLANSFLFVIAIMLLIQLSLK